MQPGRGARIYGGIGDSISVATETSSSPSIFGYKLPTRPLSTAYSIPTYDAASAYGGQASVGDDQNDFKGFMRTPFAHAFQEIRECFNFLPLQWKFTNDELRATIHVFLSRTPLLLALGAYLQSSTDFAFGPAEVILATALGFFSSALMCSQLNTHIGVSPSCAIFVSSLHVFCGRLGLPFLPALAWTSLWCAFVLLAVSAAGLQIEKPSKIGWEVGRLFVAITMSCQGISLVTRSYDALGVAPGLVATWLACGTVLTVLYLSMAENSSLFSVGIRRHFTDQKAMWALILFTGLQGLPFYIDPPLGHLRLFFPAFGSRSDGSGFLYLPVSLLAVPRLIALGAALPGSLLAALLFTEHTMAGRQSSATLLLLSSTAIVCGLFGLPPIVTLLPESTPVQKQQEQDEPAGGRASLLLMATALFLLLLPGVQRLPALVPQPVCAGLLIAVGVCYLPSLSFSSRLLSLATDARMKPYVGSESRFRRFALPAAQAVLAGCLIGLLYTPAAVAFPFFLLLLLLATQPILHTCFGDTPADPIPLLDEPSLPCPVGVNPSPLPNNQRSRRKAPTRWTGKEVWVAPKGISSMQASPRREKAEIEDGKVQGEGEESGRGSPKPDSSEHDPIMFDNALFEVLPLPPINPTKEPCAITTSFTDQVSGGCEPKRVGVQQGGESGKGPEERGVRKMVASNDVREQSVAAIIHQAVHKAVVI